MKNKKDEELDQLLKSASSDATHFVSSPDTIEKLRAKGIKIEEKFITYDEYFEKLIKQKRKNAIALLQQLPLLDKSIANGVVQTIYEEIRASYGLGIFTSTIFNSIVLLEYAMKIRIFEERRKMDPTSQWEEIEKLNMKSLISRLYKMKIIDENEREILDDFNLKVRNPYLHINIHKLIDGIYANNIQRVDIKTKEVTEENEVDVTKRPELWFMAKNFYDRSRVLDILRFCVKWTNDLLART